MLSRIIAFQVPLLLDKTQTRRKTIMTALSSSTISVGLTFYALLSGLALGVVPPKPTIDNPCRITSSVSPEFPPLDSLLVDTIVELNGAYTSAHQLMMALQGDGFLTSTDIAKLTGFFTHLPGLPLRLEEDIVFFLHEMVSIMLQVYHDTSVYIIFVKEALQEQLAFDGGLLKNEIRQLESSLYSVLCKVDTLLKSQGATVSRFVDSSAMPSYLKNIEDSTVRYQKSYLLAKDAKIFLNHLTMNYASLLETVQA